MTWRNQKGQGLIEYIILVALVAVASMAFVRTFQHNLNVQLANISNSISGEKNFTQHKGTNQTGRIDKKDFGDFMNGAASAEKE